MLNRNSSPRRLLLGLLVIVLTAVGCSASFTGPANPPVDHRTVHCESPRGTGAKWRCMDWQFCATSVDGGCVYAGIGATKTRKGEIETVPLDVPASK